MYPNNPEKWFRNWIFSWFFFFWMFRILKYRFQQQNKKLIKGRINYEFLKALKTQKPKQPKSWPKNWILR